MPAFKLIAQLTISLTFIALASSPLAATASAQERPVSTSAKAATPERSSKRIRVFIAAAQPSVAEFVRDQRSRQNLEPARLQQSRYAAELSREQDDLSRRLVTHGVKELSRLRVALNGFRASVEADKLDALRAVKGVKSVTPIRHHELANIDSVPWVQAPQLWETLGDGEGMTIAIIDAGIDYLHANFGGSGNPEDYAKNDFGTLEAGTFPTAKVVGGWDFAGPTYNSRIDDEPLPDPDPIDGHGHGSHVAGTAAGFGVNGHIGPGVARGASLLAVKIFSDLGGSTDLTVDGIEFALDPNGDGSMDDHVDVINMSLGARFGLPTDPSAVATSNAVGAGVIVVASAGNNGNLPYVVGSPGVSPEAITVAASISGGRRQIALSTNLGENPLMPALEGAGPVKLGPEILQLELAMAHSSSSGDELSEACEPLSNADSVNGKAVIVKRGGCLFPVKYGHVQDAGATAIVVANTSDNVSNLLVMGGIYPEEIAIPGLMITSTDGHRLVDALEQGPAPIVRLSSGFLVPTPTNLDDVIAAFSSQGPGAENAGFKPDLAAPGRFTVSTLAGSGIEGILRRGTSMAAPHVAGMAALLKQQHPDMPPASLKALLQNSAIPSQQNGPGTESPEPLSRQGVGVIRGADASMLTSLIEPAGVSFGYINPLTSKSAKRLVTLRNMANSTRTFTVTKELAGSQHGLTVECPESVTVDPMASVEVAIKIEARADELGNDDGRMSRQETSGWCVFNDTRDELRVGFVAGADGASNAVLDTAFRQPSLMEKPVGTSKKLKDRDVRQLTNSGPQKAIAHSFVLIDQETDNSDSDIAAFGWRHTTLFTQPVFELAVALKKPWDNPSNYRYFLRVSTDNDPQYERTLFAVDWSWLGFDPGSMVTGFDYIDDLDDVGTENSVSSWIVEDADFNDRTIILPWFNAASGVNALFKPHERVLDVTLVVINRYGRQSEMRGTIDLDNPAGNNQSSHVISPGAGVEVNAGNDGQLWLVPTNPIRSQLKIVN